MGILHWNSALSRTQSECLPAPLEGHGLHFGYARRRVIDGVDLLLEAGKLIGVIGPNGAGKSTLVRLLSGILRPEFGQIRIEGRHLDTWGQAELARTLAVVSQDPELPQGFTAWELVMMGRTPHAGWLGRESEADRAIVHAAMSESGALEFADRPIGQLSGGERQRVVVARALAQEPHILLLDEPTAHLDIKHQVETLDLIAWLVRDRAMAGMAILHDLNLAAQYCDELLLLSCGQIVARGAPNQVLTNEAIRAAYGADVTIVPHPQNGLPVVLPVCRCTS